MPEISKDVATSRSLPEVLSNSREIFIEGGRYVFDGNRVIPRLNVGKNGRETWRLDTIDHNLSVAVGRDLRVRTYSRTSGPCEVRLIREFESARDALKHLDEAIYDCARYGHAWSPTQTGSAGWTEYVWEWCVLCGAERVQFTDADKWLMWPDDAAEIAAGTAGALPTLHGPVVGGLDESH